MFLWLIYFHALIKGFLLKEEIGLIFSLCITFHCPEKSKSLVSVDPELIKKPLIVWFFRGEKRLQSEAFVTLFEVLKSICICFICNVTCFVQYQSPHLEFRSQYRRILFGYQARIFDFSFLNVSHKSLSSREQRHIWMSERILYCVISVKTPHARSKLYLNKRVVKS